MTDCKHRYYIRALAMALGVFSPTYIVAQTTYTDSITPREETLHETGVTARRKAVQRMSGAQNGFTLSRTELFKAACCNLGESFTTNPSVDVNYTDAATGAKQIKLLGLSGTYVQMLSENVPDLRGAASPFALDFVPGTWMQSIQVSKGSASVKNGYEGITGQINVEYKKPQAENNWEANIYGNTKSRFEANTEGNIHLNERLSTGLLLHYEDNYAHHDENHDGFLDKPNVRQGHLMNRWAWTGDRYIFQVAVNGLTEKREGGQTAHAAMEGAERYQTRITTNRFSGFAKNAFILNKEHGTNIALILSGTYHDGDAQYGHRYYNATERTGYASLLFETDFTPHHNLSAGLSVNHDYYNQSYRLTHLADDAAADVRNVERETVPGAYTQYTLNLDGRWVVMAGLRADHSSLYGAFLTPRFHLKYAPNDRVSLRLAAGKGYRTVHPLAEWNYLLASNRRLVIDQLPQEAAWNYGASVNGKIPIAGHLLDLSADYYYTRFDRQAVIDYDSDTHLIYIHDSETHHGYSHTMQAEATYPFGFGLTATAAYRYNLVRQYSGGSMRERPLQSRYKALLSLSYKTPLELWQVDVTATLNGGGRLPLNEVANGEASTHFSAYAGLNAQVTRWFRRWSIYVGGENLTNYRQSTPILHASEPWSDGFDATQVWGPVHGIVGYVGVRITPFD